MNYDYDVLELDPIKDLETSKLNLKKFIFDENKNDLTLLHNLEDKLKHSDGINADDNYFLSSYPVKENPRAEETIEMTNAKEELSQLIRILVVESMKIGMRGAKEVVTKAVSRVDEFEVFRAMKSQSHRRRKRSAMDQAAKHQLESNTLEHILQEVKELQSLLSAEKEEEPGTSWYKVRTRSSKEGGSEEQVVAGVKGAPGGEGLKRSLMDGVTTLLSRSAVARMVGDPGKTSITQVLARTRILGPR